MTADEKLLDKIRRNPAGIRLSEAKKAAELIGFRQASVNGSHFVYKRAGEFHRLNFQKQKDGKIPAYQGDQLIEMIEKYGSSND